MKSVQGQLQGVWSAVAAATGGQGAAVMFMGARRGDGVSVIARSFASLCAARAPKSVWLLDLDFFSDGQFKALAGGAASFGGPYDMTFGQAPFWKAAPRAPDGGQGEGAVVSYRCKIDKLYVSRFAQSAIGSDQKLKVTPAPDYWQAVRTRVDMTIVDAPALEQSHVGLALVGDMDGVILVIDSDTSDARDAIEMRDEVMARGGTCLGVVVSRGGKKRQKAMSQRPRSPAHMESEV
jgi:Mrp family chromosome partitioning ATPase